MGSDEEGETKREMFAKRNSLMANDDLFDPSVLEDEEGDWKDVFDDYAMDEPSDALDDNSDSLMPPPENKIPSNNNDNDNNNNSDSDNAKGAAAATSSTSNTDSAPDSPSATLSLPIESPPSPTSQNNKRRRRSSAELESVDKGLPPPSWHSEAADLPHRQAMIKDIAQLLYARKKDNPSKKWIQRLPLKARMLENQLYKGAASLEAYLDRSTLKNRLGKLASAITTHYRQAIHEQDRRTVARRSSAVQSSSTVSNFGGAFPTNKLSRQVSEPVVRSSLNSSLPSFNTPKLRRESSDSVVQGAASNNDDNNNNNSSGPANNALPANNTTLPSNNAQPNKPNQNPDKQQGSSTGNANNPLMNNGSNGNNNNTGNMGQGFNMSAAQQKAANEQYQQQMNNFRQQQQAMNRRISGGAMVGPGMDNSMMNAAMMGGANGANPMNNAMGVNPMNQNGMMNAMNMRAMNQFAGHPMAHMNAMASMAHMQNGFAAMGHMQNGNMGMLNGMNPMAAAGNMANPLAAMAGGGMMMGNPAAMQANMLNYSLPNVIPGGFNNGAQFPGANNVNANNSNGSTNDMSRMPPPATMNGGNTPSPMGKESDDSSPLSPGSFRW